MTAVTQESPKPHLGEPMLALIFYTIPAHGFFYHEVCMKGIRIVDGLAIAASLFMLIMATWSAAWYFRKVQMSGPFSWAFVVLFAAVVTLCMASQGVLAHLDVNALAARVSGLVAVAVSWPVVALLHWVMKEMRTEEKSTGGL